MSTQAKCIIVTGRPGSGKTTLAAKLAAEICLPLISRDAIKEGYVNTYGTKHAALPANTNAKVSQVFFEVALQHLSANISLVMEAAFQHAIWLTYISQLRAVSDPCVVLCSVTGKLAAERHLQRGLADHRREYYHGDSKVTQFKETGMVPPPANYIPPDLDIPTLEVTTDEGYRPSLDEVINFVGFNLPNNLA